MSFFESLIIVSEKAANIARLCRQENKLFELLVQEKDVSEANPRFVQDFKTLADVLIQETVKHDIGKRFPNLANDIKGEESNVFSNSLGDTVRVEVQETAEKTANLLKKILDGNTEVATLMATEVHRSINLSEVDTAALPSNKRLNVELSSLGLWIDPIDSTSEYINAKEERNDSGIFIKGLRCVTVLIGAYDKNSGAPVFGVVNQPFFKTDGTRWRGRCFWGIAESRINSLSPVEESSKKTVCLSSTEDEDIKKKLKENGFSVIEAAGAGYKILTVILGLADAYVLSKGTTFKWDTCGCHAILKSLGGDIVEFNNTQSSISYKDVNLERISNKNEVFCNSNGIIAVRNGETLEKIKQVIFLK